MAHSKLHVHSSITYMKGNKSGCLYSRVDLLVTDAGDCYVLEVNTLPGMTALSLFPEIAAKGAGLSFEDLVDRIIRSAALKNISPNFNASC